MGKNTKKILLISLDGATWDVLSPILQLQIMPHLTKAMRQGFVSNLQSVVPPVTAAAWTSFMTGKNPNRHGIYEFRNFDPILHRDFMTNISQCRSELLWEILSEQGCKSIVLNLPYMYPLPKINGIVVSGFDTPSLDCEFTYPKKLKIILD